MKLASAVALFASLAFAASASAQTTWVVDPGPGGHFDSIQEAHASPAVVDGDVLLVHGGVQPFGTTTLYKRLALHGIGVRLPEILDLRVFATGGFLATRLHMHHFEASGVTGLLHLDRCLIGETSITTPKTSDPFSINHGDDVLISRSTVTPGAAWIFGFDGLFAIGSQIRIVDTHVQGGRGMPAGALDGLGGAAIRLISSTLWVAGSHVEGGAGLRADGTFGQPGVGIASTWSTADVRGAAQHVVRAGVTDLPPLFEVATDVLAGSADSIQLSGVTVIGGGDHVFQPSTLPYLTLDGAAQPGAPIGLHLYGDAGALGVVLASLQSGKLALPFVTHGPAWFDPASLVLVEPVVLAGLATPAGPTLVEPADPALAGLALHVAGFQFDGAGAWISAPGTALVLAH